MPAPTYAGNNVFPTTITEVQGGGALTSSAVNVGLEGLADRTVYLKTIKDSEDGRPLRNLRAPAVVDTAAAGFSFAYTRGDGTAAAFYSPGAHLWIKTGYNTSNGQIYIGDLNQWGVFDTGTSSIKTSFGCDSASLVASGRISVYDGALRTTGGGVDPRYILGPSSGGITGTWTVKSLDTIGSFVSYVRAYDAIVTDSGQRVIVVGGGDLVSTGQFLAWKSDDHGNTFTRVTVGNVSASQDALTRIIKGKSNRLVSWIKTSSANQGNKLFYSDDNGNTWSSRSGIGFDQIGDGCYLPDLDLWAFASASSFGIYTTPDPVLGAFTFHDTIVAPDALAGFGHYLLFSRSNSSVDRELFLSTNGLSSFTVVGRNTAVGSDAFTHIAASPLGQFTASTAFNLWQTDRV